MKFLGMLLSILMMAGLTLTGCSFDLHNPRANEYDVQIIGDSVFDLSGDIHTTLKSLSGKSYKDRSVSGAKIAAIVTQYSKAISNQPSLRTVIADGGANDILQGSMDCDSDPLTGGCLDVIDYIADNMENVLEDMYEDTVDDCVWLGYYHVKGSEAGKNEAIDYCYSDIYPGVFGSASMNLYGPGGAYLVDSRPYITPAHIKSDDIHPTTAGSEILGNLIWNVMVAENTYR